MLLLFFFGTQNILYVLLCLRVVQLPAVESLKFVSRLLSFREQKPSFYFKIVSCFLEICFSC